MTVTINTNSAATIANYNLGRSNALLLKSMTRLSSGLRINEPSDDPGGLAMSMKLSASITRTDATNTNVMNAQSLLQTQDGAFQTANTILDRIAELKVLSEDVTKSESDVENYEIEFDALKEELNALSSQSFNGVSLFTSGASAETLTVITTENGAGTVDISKAALANAIATTTSADDLDDIDTDDISTDIENLATLRAANGAESSRLGYAANMLAVNRQNLEAANSRILDVDLASESTQLARASILAEFGSAMLVRANASTAMALKLLD